MPTYPQYVVVVRPSLFGLGREVGRFDTRRAANKRAKQLRRVRPFGPDVAYIVERRFGK